VIDLTFGTNLGMPQYTLYDGDYKLAVYQYSGGIEIFNESPVVEVVAGTTTPPQVRAIASGTANLRLNVNGEIYGYAVYNGCSMYWYFTGASSDIISVSVTNGTPPPPSTCTIDYNITNDWGSGFTANVAITNLSSTAINGWTLGFTFPGNQSIGNAWGGTVNQTGQTIIITDSGWNAYLAANGGSTNVGFQATYSGINEAPSQFTLNGTLCN
jgi:hypothetical protein